jgi:UDP-glucose 4-epimerase
MTVLVTGGAGYIGSHTCLELLNRGYDVVVADNLVNSSKEALRRVSRLSGKKPAFYETDLRDREALENIFREKKIEAVIHFAGLKAVGESVYKPLEYYQNNITGTLVLCECMKKYGVKKIIFSSSATVYGKPAFVPITEDCPLGEITNPYGRTKAMLEQILADLYTADPEWSVTLLRYFNPIGADKSGQIGEDPKDVPNNLLPFVTQVAVGRLPVLSVFGNDYPTPDGTCIRDFIHVTDLARGHIQALEHMREGKEGIRIYNLGTGRGYSVLELIRAFEKANNVKVPFEIRPRRPGDIPVSFADPSKAEKELGWKAEKTLEEMCRDAFRWQKNNPYGYRPAEQTVQ